MSEGRNEKWANMLSIIRNMLVNKNEIKYDFRFSFIFLIIFYRIYIFLNKKFRSFKNKTK